MEFCTDKGDVVMIIDLICILWAIGVLIYILKEEKQ